MKRKIAITGLIITGILLWSAILAATKTYACSCGEDSDSCAKLTVVVNVVNTGGGTKSASDFTVMVSGDNPSPSTFQGSASGTLVSMGTGTYHVSQASSSDYTAGFSADCSGTMERKDAKTCVITDTFVPPAPTTGSISVCKAIVNASGTVVDGTAFPGQTFTVPGFVSVPSTTAAAAGLLPTAVFTTPLSANAELFGASAANAQCVTYNNLALGHYYYGEERIASSSYNWAMPLYNDQDTVTANATSDFFSYSGQLFDNDPTNDGLRNTNADGDIYLEASRPTRQLIVLNRFLGAISTSTPTSTIPSADISIAKVADVTSTVEGGTVHYTLTVTALGPSTSTGVVATDTLPSGLTFLNATSSNSEGSYVSSTGSWMIGDMPVSSTATLAIAAVVNATGTITNTASVGENSSTTDPNTTNNNATSSITATPAPAATCSDVIVSDATNMVNGSSAALVATPYDSRWTASIPGATWIWATPYVTDPAHNQTFTFTKDFMVTGGPLAAHLDIAADNSYDAALNGTDVALNSGEFNYFLENEGHVDALSAVHQGVNHLALTVTNFGLASSTAQSNPAGLLYKLTVTEAGSSCGAPVPTPTSTIPSADISIAKVADVTSTVEGGTVHYTLTVTALGPSTSTGVVATDTLPSGLTFLNATSSNSEGSYVSSTGSWMIGDMPVSSTATLAIAAVVNATGTITNTASVGENSSTTDPNLGNNSSDATVLVGTGGSPALNTTSTLSVSVSGLNASDTATITVLDSTASATQSTSTGNGTGLFVLPTNDLYGVTAASSNYVVATSSGCAGTLSASTTCSVTFTPTAIANNTADVAITKTVDNANPKGGDTITYTLTATDLGSVTSTYVVVNDILPIGLSVNSITSSQGTSSMGATIGWSVGTISPNATATLVISVTVLPQTAGTTLTNTATIKELDSLVDDPANNSSSVSIAVQAAPCTSNCGGGGGGGGGGGSTVLGGGGGSAYSISIDSGAPSTATTSVTLSLYGTGAYTMELSNTPDFAGATWEPYVTTKPWVIGSTQGTETVYVKYRSVTNTDIGTADDSIQLLGGQTGGQVLGASVSCGMYLRDYIKLGANNDPSEVKKLQEFLNQNLGINLPVTGYYGSLTYNAVIQFQLKYNIKVLEPWVPHGLKSNTIATGYVYKTTRWWINMLMCPSLNLQIPQLP